MTTSPKWPNLVIACIAVYLGWYLTTPYNSPRLHFLATVKFERIIIIVTSLAILARGMNTSIRYRTVVLSAAMCVVMYVSFLMSPCASEPRCQYWADEYWKKFAIFAFLVFGIRELRDLEFLTRFSVLITFLYQLLTWKDYLNGGAFVYQQGMKRMCGSWSGGGLGSANGYASLCLFVLPLSICLWQLSPRLRTKLFLSASICVSILSILCSGTRAAIYVGVIYAIYLGRHHVLRLRSLAILLAAAVALSVLPSAVVDRVFNRASNDAPPAQHDIANVSAESRLWGFLDGVALGNERPFLGYGPESSAIARHRIRDLGMDLALHNLYGQVIGELGWGGFTLWLFLIGGAIWSLHSIHVVVEGDGGQFQETTNALRQGFIQCFAVMLLYGLAAHSLYDIRWFVLLGFQTALTSVVCLWSADSLDGTSSEATAMSLPLQGFDKPYTSGTLNHGSEIRTGE